MRGVEGDRSGRTGSGGPGSGAGPLRVLGVAAATGGVGAGLWLVTLPWLASSVTGDPIAISGLMAASSAAGFLFTLPMGVAVDRWDRRRTAMACGTAAALLVLGFGATFQFTRGLGALYAAAFTVAAARMLLDSASVALVADLTRADGLASAHGRLLAVGQACEALAAPLGAALLGLGTLAATGSAAGAFGITALVLAALPRRASGEAASRGRVPLSSMALGVRLVWALPWLRTMLLVSAAWTLLVGVAWSTLVLFARETLGVGASGYSALVAVGALGAAAGSLCTGPLLRRFGDRAVLQLSVGGSATALLLAGASPSLPWAVAALGAAAFLAVLWDVGCLALLQSRSSTAVMGRVTAAWRMTEIGMLPVGTLLGGLVAAGATHLVDRPAALRAPLLVAGAALLACAAVVARSLTRIAGGERLGGAATR